MEVSIFDTETASLEGGVCEIAIARIDEDFNVLWEAQSLIDPEIPISPQASGIHHIVDEMVWSEPTLEEFMTLHEFPFEASDLVVAGHNVQFDCRVTEAWLPTTHKRICTLRMARALWPDMPDHKLQTLRYTFRLDAGEAHRAMGDVLACLNLMRLIHKEHGLGLTEQLELSSRPMSLDSRISFGKHKGSRLRDIPAGWVAWLLKQSNVDPDLRTALEQRS